MKKALIAFTLLTSTLALADAGSSILTTRLNGKTLVCSAAGKEIGRIRSNKGKIKVSEGLCWGGSDVSVESTSNFVMITCGDDGQQTTALKLNQKLAKGSDDIDGTTYANISAGYPYENGSVQYITCASK